jgi:hypothetical protein
MKDKIVNLLSRLEIELLSIVAEELLMRDKKLDKYKSKQNTRLVIAYILGIITGGLCFVIGYNIAGGLI